MTAFRLRNRIILSWGLGVDSTAILLRWLTDPNSRDFDLVDLIVVVAMTGDEFPDLAPMIEEHVLPLMRQHGVRLVQLARGGHSVHDGVDVLSDSRCPDKLYVLSISAKSRAGQKPSLRKLILGVNFIVQ